MPQPEKQNIFVPVGGGYNADIESAVLPPPFSADVRNVVARKQGSYAKLPGSNSDNLSPTDNGFLLSDPGHGLVFVGLNGTRHRGNASSSWTTQSKKSSPMPCRVSAVPVKPIRGEIAQATVCVNDGYIATACSSRNTVSLDNYTTHWVITNATGDILASYEDNTVDFFPRIEAITISAVPYFVLFALVGTPGSGAPTFTLKTARVNATSPPASLTWNTVGTVNRAAGTTTAYRAGLAEADKTVKFMYDTHADIDHNYAYVMYYDGTNMVAHRTDGNTVNSAVTIVAGSQPGFAIFHSKVDETVLVALTSSSIYYADSALTSFSSVGGSITPTHPVWYVDHNGQIYMDGMAVTVTIAPTFSGARDHTPPGKTYDPQNIAADIWGDGDVLFFNHEAPGPGTTAGFTLEQDLRELSWLDAVALTSGKPFTVAPLLQSRLDTAPNFGAVHQELGLAYAIFQQPQSSRDANGRVYLPMVCHTKAAPKLPVVGDGDGRGAFDGYQPNHDRYFGFLVLDFLQTPPVHTVIPHQQSLVVAAGNVMVWDGANATDLVAPPRIVGYDDGDPPAVTSGNIDREDVGDSTALLITTPTVTWWAMRAVLVYTDRNGIEYRSAPSNTFTSQGIDHDTSTLCPVIELSIDDSHQRVFERGGSFDVEIYTTERATGAASEAAIDHTYYLAQRSPLLYQGSSGIDYYVLDVLQQRFDGTATFAPGTTSVPLYTDQGELAPIRPPASNVLASAGNYLFLVPSEFPSELWPTKPIEHGRGPEWAPELILPSPPSGGNIVSIAGQGDRLLVLCENGVWELFVGGGGPDANGGGSFGQYRNLVFGDGCITHKATVVTPKGVFYLAKSGPKLAKPDGSIEDIGKLVRGLYATAPDFGQSTKGGASAAYVLGSTYHAGQQEVWLFQSDRTLIFNLEKGVWTYSDKLWYGGVHHDGEFYRRITTGNYTIVYETEAQSKENGATTILPVVTSPWLSFQSPGGYHRCRRLSVIGKHTSGTTGSIKVTLHYDYLTSVSDTFTFTASAIDSSDKDFLLRVKPSRQKFAAIRVTVEGLDVASDNTHIWSLIGYEFEMSAKSGVIKLQNASSG